jgi:hypothetical protein
MQRVESAPLPVGRAQLRCPSTRPPSRASGLTRQWHPTRNLPLQPRDVTPGSDFKAWWRCPRDDRHEWQASVWPRALRGCGCPFCRGLRVTPESSLAGLFPEVAKEWHPTKNGSLTPSDVPRGTLRRVWWRCSRNPQHEWCTSVLARTGPKTRCPFCSGKRATPETSLAALHPQLALEWHPTKNAPLKPTEVRPGSGKKVWWRCAFDRRHEWRAVIGERTGNSKTGCPHCHRERTTKRPRRRRSARVTVPLLLR